MLKKILSFTSKSGKALIAAATVSFIAAELLWAYFLYIAVDTMSGLLANEGGADTNRLIVAGVVLLVVKTVFAIIADLTKHFAGFDVVETVRLRLIDKLKSLSLGFFTNERLGEVSTVIHKDVDAMEGVIGHFFSVMWSDIAVAVLMGIWLFAKSWLLGLCMISLLPFAAAALFLGLRRSQRAQRKTNDDLADMVSLFVEYTKGIPLMKAFSENSAFLKKLGGSVEAFGQSSRRQSKLIAGYNGRFSFFFELSGAVMLIAGALLLVNGTITPNVFLYFIIFSGVFYKPFSKMELYFLEYVKVADSYRRVTNVLETPSVPMPQNPKEHTDAFGIAFESVGFSYVSSEDDGDFSLKNVSFQVPQGSLTALVGPSGSGKTTVTNLLLRFWDVESGSIKIGGTDIRDMSYDTLLENVSIVMQNVYLTADTILENIRFGKRDATREKVIEAAKRAQIHDFIAGLPDGYDTMVGESGVGLSGGQKQRVSIARAFLKDAPIVVLDEITSNVDPMNETKIQKAISELARNRTVLVIAHHLRTIQTADQILVFDKGELVEQGTHVLLAAKGGLYAQLWKAQEMAKGWKIA
jgi:ATP-binding cassette subfamily B protein